MNGKLKNGVPLDELLKNYENHREKYIDRRNEVTKGWKDLNYKHEINYTPISVYHLEKAYGDKYNTHNSEEVINDIPYWDSKENDSYWSLPRRKRILMFIQERVNIKYYEEFLYFNLIMMIILIYYANKKSKQIII